jgi:hypothetical protein
VHAKASTKCPYLTLENPHHQRHHCRWPCGHQTITVSVSARPKAERLTPGTYLIGLYTRRERPTASFKKPIHNVKEITKAADLPGKLVTSFWMPTYSKLVEPIGIEPMTSSLQS